MLREVKNALRPLAATPLHPQWLARGARRRLERMLGHVAAGSRVLDIGCADRWPRERLDPATRYIGLDDWATSRDWYHSVPDLYGDARRLPIAAESVDWVLLLDVLEHVPDTDGLMREIHRVLRPGGRLLAQVPFLYPLHDEPRDYLRLTRHGFEALAARHGYRLEACHPVGHPLESAALVGNIALAKTGLDWLSRGHPALLLLPLLPLAILAANLLAWLLARVSPRDPFMPYSYQLLLVKA